MAKTLGVDLQTPWKDLPAEHQALLLHGAGDRHITYEWKQRAGMWKHGGTWEGIVPQLLSSFKKTAAGPWRMAMEKYMRVGTNVNPRSCVRPTSRSISDLCRSSLRGRSGSWLSRAAGP